jgi:hypothetical protein
VHLFGFIIKQFVTTHGHMNVKKSLNDVRCFCVHPEGKELSIKKYISNKKYSENLDVPLMVLIYLTTGNEVIRNDHSCSSQPVMQGVSLITYSE